MIDEKWNVTIANLEALVEVMLAQDSPVLILSACNLVRAEVEAFITLKETSRVNETLALLGRLTIRAQELLGDTSAQTQMVTELEHAAENLQAMSAVAK